MKTSTALAVLLPLLVLTSLAAFYFGIENQRKSVLIRELQAARDLPPVARDPAPRVSHTLSKKPAIKIVRKSKYETRDVTCYLCKGRGEIDWDENRPDKGTYPCPVCVAQGTNHIKMTHGAVLCDRCKGMGRTAKLEMSAGKEKYFAKICTRCNGTGWLKKKP